MWPSVIGQERVKRTLLAAVRARRLPHALLFTGSEGVGKDAMALELARVLHCARGGEEACGACASCRAMAKMQHPDLRLIVALPRGTGETKDDGPLDRLSASDLETVREWLARKASDPYIRVALPRATGIKVNSIRELRREAATGSSDGKQRVFLVSQADQMNDESANMLLKTLEEPSGPCVLILTTARRDALLPTIRSRCQEIRFDPLREEEIRDALVARGAAEPGPATLAARLANGSYTHALELLGDDLQEERREAVAFLRHLLGQQVHPLGKDIDRLADAKDRDLVGRFLVLLLVWFRDALAVRHGGTIINVDQQEDLERFVSRFPAADFREAMGQVESALSLLDRNVYIKLVLLQLAVRLKTIILRPA
jgi:DNA polymerase-3 subunit delta'